jgi:S-adenosyl-L-methionine hydrolase (adenosine-forming)
MKETRHPLITLTTDFGFNDEYVGIVKGVILRTCRYVNIIDLTHGIEPGNIPAAAMTIASSFHFFPQGTVHMVVVDPGVGSTRRILAAHFADHFFIAPDNGTLTSFLTDKSTHIFHVCNRKLFADTISSTFHCRDIMAPVAAMLADGMDISVVGPELSSQQCCQIHLPTATVSEGKIIGEIIHIDHFGNIRTSVTRHDLSLVAAPGAAIKITLGNHSIDSLSTCYAGHGPEAIIALIDSRNHLEIAVYNKSAASILGCSIGETIIITRVGT